MKKTKINVRILVLLVGLCLGFINSGKAQPQLTFRHDPSSFIGKWEAMSGNKSFELIIRKDQIYLELFKDYSDILLGEMTYKTNGTITRYIKIDGIESIFSGSMSTPTILNFRFLDKERKIAGEGTMTLNPDNPQEANWELRKSPNNMLRSGWGKVDFDIPTELEWVKVE